MEMKWLPTLPKKVPNSLKKIHLFPLMSLKTIIKSNTEAMWKESHPAFNPKDPYYQLRRQEQVLIFRLRTKHNRLRHHLFHKFRIGETDQCPCGTGSQTTEHILQTCPLLDTRTRKVLAGTHSRDPKALRRPVGPAVYGLLYLWCWSCHLTNEKKKNVIWKMLIKCLRLLTFK